MKLSIRNRLLLIALLFLSAAYMTASCSGASDDDDSADDADDDSADDDTNWGGDDDTGDDDTASDDADDDDVSPPERFYASEVVDYEIGESGGYGEEELPDSVLGAPAGFGLDQGNNDPEQVFSLGHGGRITLKMSKTIVDGEGPDFTIFENAFRIGGNDDLRFVEAAFVEVSEDGETFVRFPNDYDPSGGGDNPQAYPGNFQGFAGLEPVYANLDPDSDGNESDFIDPGDPAVSGGDPFDLADVGLDHVDYIRIIDTGSVVRAPGTESYDDDGTLIEDQGNLAPASGNKDGFDLDAIVVLNF